MTKELVKLNDGKEVEIDCKFLTGRKAFQLAPKILNITSIKGKKGDEDFAAECDMNSAVDLCWDYIVVECPHIDHVCAEGMQRIYDLYAKKEIDFALKKNLENFKV